MADLDVIVDRDLKPGNLNNSICSIYKRDVWEVTPSTSFARVTPYPVINGTGQWLGSNDQVWEMLLPAIKIASRYMMSSHLLPWVQYFPEIFFFTQYD